jgi:TRAP transporter TAXI family solute receptor
MRWRLRDWIVAILAVAAFGLAVVFYVHQPKEAPVSLTLTGGDTVGIRHRMAEMLAHEARAQELRIRVIGTAGSEESLRKVEAGQLDVALIMGGLNTTHFPHVQQVAALHLEPLHLLVKDELADLVTKDLQALKGKTINLQGHGAGTHWLAASVLEFAGLRYPHGGTAGSYRVSELTYQQLERQIDPKRLPDAVFLTSTLPAPVARHLVTRSGYRLVPLPFAQAFALGSLEEDERPLEAGSAEIEIRKEHIYDAVIPAFTYRVNPGVPPDDLHTLGTRLLLVAHRRVPEDVVVRLLDAVFNTRFAKVSHPPVDTKLLELPPELPLHAGTVEYLARSRPLITGEIIDALSNSLSILGASLGGMLFTWQWVRQRYRFRRDQGFEVYIQRVSDIEQQAMDMELSSTLPLRPLLRLQRELGHLKAEALRKFAEGELEGEELMSGFLSHLNDARAYLTRLILHERENLEEQARLQGRPPGVVWEELVAKLDHASLDNEPFSGEPARPTV